MPPLHPWEYDDRYGYVHRLRCAPCSTYMQHLDAAWDMSASFRLALQGRKERLDKHRAQGFLEGRAHEALARRLPHVDEAVGIYHAQIAQLELALGAHESLLREARARIGELSAARDGFKVRCGQLQEKCAQIEREDAGTVACRALHVLNAGLQERIAGLQERIASLQEHVPGLEGHVASVELLNKKLEAENAVLAQYNSELKEKCAKQEETAAEREQRYWVLMGDYTAERLKCNITRRELERVRGERDRARDERAVLRQARDVLQRERDGLQRERDRMQRERDRRDRMQQERDEARKECDRLQSERDRLYKGCEQLVPKSDQAREERPSWGARGQAKLWRGRIPPPPRYGRPRCDSGTSDSGVASDSGMSTMSDVGNQAREGRESGSYAQVAAGRR